MINTEQELSELLDKLEILKIEIQKKIVGQAAVIDQLLISLLAGGHALLEGVPGLAKTLMIRTLAEAIDLKFRRIQFTPDLMPSDITGTEVLAEDPESGKRSFKFNPGPLFANIVLADEINRTPPKTQAALLEAMQEKSVTYAGTTYPLTPPFFILATQNPVEQAGTFPLPEAQLDRFLMFIKIDYPLEQEELDILQLTTGAKNPEVNKVLKAEALIQLQKLVREVPIAEELLQFVNTCVRSTRPQHSSLSEVQDWVAWGAGPRAGQAMILTAKARALLQKRMAVQPEDLKAVALPVLRHRILLNFKAEAEKIESDQIIERILEAVQKSFD